MAGGALFGRVKSRPAWDEFCAMMAGRCQLSPIDLANLSLATLRELGIECGWTSAVKLAQVELTWKELQVQKGIETGRRTTAGVNKQRSSEDRNTGVSGGGSETLSPQDSTKLRQEDEEVETSAQHHHATPPSHRSAQMMDRKQSAVGIDWSEADSPEKLKFEEEEEESPRRNRGNGVGTADRTSSTALHNKRTTPSRSSTNVPRTGSKKPSVGASNDPSPKPRTPPARATPTPYRKQKTTTTEKSPMSHSPALSATQRDRVSQRQQAAVQTRVDRTKKGGTLQRLFIMYSGEDDGDSARMSLEVFFAMIHDAGLLDRNFSEWDAENVFSTSLHDKVATTISYPQFRLRLIPNMAGRLRMTISDLMKTLSETLAFRLKTDDTTESCSPRGEGHSMSNQITTSISYWERNKMRRESQRLRREASADKITTDELTRMNAQEEERIRETAEEKFLLMSQNMERMKDIRV